MKTPHSVMSQIYPEYQEYRKRWALATKKELIPRYPLHLDIDLIDKCNLGCIFCHQRYRKRSNDKMSKELFQKILTEGASKGLCAINFGAVSEPLLEKGLFFDILDLVKGKIMDIRMHTNAVLLDGVTAGKIIDKGALTMICFSIDAFSPEVYKRVRGAELDKTVDNILLFLSKKKGSLPLTRVSFVACRDNEHEIAKFKEFWNDKVDAVEIQGYQKIGESVAPARKSAHKPYQCSDPWRRAMVWPNGDVTLCCSSQEDDVLIGNCRYDTIEALWNSARMEKVRDEFKRGYHAKGSTCYRCATSFYEIDDS